MRSNEVSRQRRNLMIAGLAGTVAPAFAGQLAVDELGAVEREGGLVVSGRILAGNGRPLAGAAVEIWRTSARGDAASAMTDGDGRFFARVASDRPGRPHHIHYRVSEGGRTLATQELYFARGREVAEHQAGHLQRDDTGAWRAAFGVTLA